MLTWDYGVFVSINVMRIKCSIQQNNCKYIRLQIQVLYYCAFEFIAWNKRIFAKIALLSFQIGFKFQWNDVILCVFFPQKFPLKTWIDDVLDELKMRE